MSNPAQEQVITAEQIDRAISWYEANADEVAAILPIQSPGIYYKTGSLKLLGRFIEAWKAKKLSLFLAGAYVHRPLIIFYQELKPRDLQDD